MPISQARRGPDGALILEDGRRFEGTLAGRGAPCGGEVVFTTNLTGYQEVLTDPSFAGQIVVMTAPMMGTYGVHDEDRQSRRPWISGFVVRELTAPGPGRGETSLSAYLEEHGVPTLEGVDTRALTRHIRDAGAMRAVVVPAGTSDQEAREILDGIRPMKGRDLATEVTTETPYHVEARGEERGLVACVDYGVKQRSLDLIAGAGYRVRVHPAGDPPERLLEDDPDGYFISNGPGDPDAVSGAVDRVRTMVDSDRPVFGICLGHQLIARAFGGRNYKLLYGHRGGNHPVRNLDTGAVEVTSQNHGFAVEEDGGAVAGAPELRVTHRNLNDGTVEGIAHREAPVFAVQYHPESAPGPHDSRYLFERFVDTMEGS